MTLDVADFNAWVTALAAVTAVLAWAWRKALSGAWEAAWKFVAGLLHMVETFPALAADVSFVKHEVKYNGGSTNKDMTRRLVHTVEYLLGEAQISTFTSNAQGQIISVSDRALERLQCQRQDLLGNGWKSFLTADTAEKIVALWDDAVADGRGLHVNGVKLQTERGVLTADVELIALRGNDGEFTGHIGYVRKSVLP